MRLTKAHYTINMVKIYKKWQGEEIENSRAVLCGLANLGIILLKNRICDLSGRAGMIFSRKEIYEE